MIQSEEPDEKSFRLVSLLEDSKYAGLVSFEKNKGIGLNHNVCTVDSNKFRFEYNPDERKLRHLGTTKLLHISLIAF